MFRNSKQLADMLVRIKQNELSRSSFAASDNSADNNYDQLCANTIRKIMIQSVSGPNDNQINNLGLSRSYAAAFSDAAAKRSLSLSYS